MPQILITLNEVEDKLVQTYKIAKGLKSKDVAIRTMIGEFSSIIEINK